MQKLEEEIKFHLEHHEMCVHSISAKIAWNIWLWEVSELKFFVICLKEVSAAPKMFSWFPFDSLL